MMRKTAHMNTESHTTFRKVTAIIRKELLQAVLEQLQQAGVGGVSIYDVVGFGEYEDFYRHDWAVTHAKVEVFCSTQEAEQIVEVIHDAAATGMAGDGIIAILPVESLRHIRGDRAGT